MGEEARGEMGMAKYYAGKRKAFQHMKVGPSRLPALVSIIQVYNFPQINKSVKLKC